MVTRTLMGRRIACFLLLLIVGCGGEERPYTDHSKDPEAFARNVKQVVLNSAADARGSDEPEASMLSIIHMLEDLDRVPVGSYRGVYEQLRSTATEIYQAAEASPRPPANLRSRLDELVTLAEQLPGDVKAQARESS